MTRRASGLRLLLIPVFGWALGCAALQERMETFEMPSLPGGSEEVEAPDSVAEQSGAGPVPVFGSSLYSPGQLIFKELRQEDSLMAFLACQGEPDRVEVVEDGNGVRRIFLEYRRRGLPQKGTVVIAPSPAGYYAAQPINPEGRLPGAGGAAPSRPAPPPPPSPPRPEPIAAPEPEPEPEPILEELSPEPVVEEPEPEPPPAPTPEQLDECPIEYWRQDCQDLCTPDASWDWCGYEG